VLSVSYVFKTFNNYQFFSVFHFQPIGMWAETLLLCTKIHKEHTPSEFKNKPFINNTKTIITPFRFLSLFRPLRLKRLLLIIITSLHFTFTLSVCGLIPFIMHKKIQKKQTPSEFKNKSFINNTKAILTSSDSSVYSVLSVC
jgi:hypothetical protein